MATLYITEFADLAFDPHGNPVMAGTLPSVAEQNVAIGVGSQQSGAFSSTTKYIMVNTDTACCLAGGSNPSANASFHRMGANETRFYGVRPGDKIAVIQASA